MLKMYSGRNSDLACLYNSTNSWPKKRLYFLELHLSDGVWQLKATELVQIFGFADEKLQLLVSLDAATPLAGVVRGKEAQGPWQSLPCMLPSERL